MSLSTLHVGGARATGAQVRGRQAHLVKDGMGGHADRPGAKGGDRLALGAGVVVGMDQRTDRMDGWLYLGSGVDMSCRRMSNTAAAADSWQAGWGL